MLPLLTLIRDFFRNHGLGKWVGELSDNDLRYLLSRAARAARKKRKGGEMNLADYGLNNAEIKFSVADDGGIDPEIRQAFPRYQSSQAKEILKKLPGKI